MTKPPKTLPADRIAKIGIATAALLFVIAAGALVLDKGALDRWIGSEVAEIGGPFELVSQEGKRFTRDDLLGHPHIVYFGFTYCPDLCPTTLFLLASIVQGLGEKAADMKVVFVSVNPERDTVPVLKEYVSAFDEDFIGLTGSPEAIAAAAKAYRVFYRKVEQEDGDYTMDHSASAQLFNADGSYAGAIVYDESEAEARAKVERLVAANSKG